MDEVEEAELMEDEKQSMREQALLCKMLADRINDRVCRHKLHSYYNDYDATETSIKRSIVVLRQELLKLSKMM